MKGTALITKLVATVKGLTRAKKRKPGRIKNTINQKIDILQINGHDFVTDLVWNPISNGRAIMSEARSYGRDNGMDVVVIRERMFKAQAGYVGKNNGVTKEMYSLASALAGIMERRHANDDELQRNYRNAQNPNDMDMGDGIGWVGVFEVAPALFQKKPERKKTNPNQKLNWKTLMSCFLSLTMILNPLRRAHQQLCRFIIYWLWLMGSLYRPVIKLVQKMK